MIAAAMLFLAAGTARPSCIPVESDVSLSGRVSHRKEYGPPNYGESPAEDRPITIVLLELSEPITVCADDFIQDAPVAGIDTLQLAASKNIRDGKIIVRGKLFFGHTGWHFTKVLMAVETANGHRVD